MADPQIAADDPIRKAPPEKRTDILLARDIMDSKKIDGLGFVERIEELLPKTTKGVEYHYLDPQGKKNNVKMRAEVQEKEKELCKEQVRSLYKKLTETDHYTGTFEILKKLSPGDIADFTIFSPHGTLDRIYDITNYIRIGLPFILEDIKDPDREVLKAQQCADENIIRAIFDFMLAEPEHANLLQTALIGHLLGLHADTTKEICLKSAGEAYHQLANKENIGEIASAIKLRLEIGNATYADLGKKLQVPGYQEDPEGAMFEAIANRIKENPNSHLHRSRRAPTNDRLSPP